MTTGFWRVYRRVNNGAWVYLDRFYWLVNAVDCIDGHKIIDKTYKRNNIEYRMKYYKGAICQELEL